MSESHEYRLHGMTAEDFKALTKQHRMPHKHRKALNSVFFWLSGATYWLSRGDSKNAESNMIIANAYLCIEKMPQLPGEDVAAMADSLFALVGVYPLRKEAIAP